MPSFQPISKRLRISFHTPALALFAAALPLFTVNAQTVPAAPAAHMQTVPPVPAAPAQAAPQPPPYAASTTPAKITMNNGELTVNAQNSDLAATLQQIARSSGMSIEGLGKTTRIFGDYGPADPKDVLTDLLSGSGYNFVMVGGSTAGMPAKLLLSEKSNSPLPRANATPAAGDDTDDTDSDQEPLGPGAIAHPSPQMNEDTDPQTRVDRNLQRLEQMHQQIMQQQQQQQQQSNPQ